MVQAKTRKKAAAAGPESFGVASGRHGSVVALAAMVVFMLLMEAPLQGLGVRG